mmetsp:Transcript_15542/g.44556  ORF Transcript_15542/g.44556 Transcript_15542/m.44556 type:complete len:200 (-) Transcript_15542:1160-1759(-)
MPRTRGQCGSSSSSSSWAAAGAPWTPAPAARAVRARLSQVWSCGSQPRVSRVGRRPPAGPSRGTCGSRPSACPWAAVPSPRARAPALTGRPAVAPSRRARPLPSRSSQLQCYLHGGQSTITRTPPTCSIAPLCASTRLCTSAVATSTMSCWMRRWHPTPTALSHGTPLSRSLGSCCCDSTVARIYSRTLAIPASTQSTA